MVRGLPVVSNFSTRASEIDFEAAVGLITRSAPWKQLQDTQAALRGSLLNTMMKRVTAEEAQKLAEHWGYMESKSEHIQEVHQQKTKTKQQVATHTEINPYAYEHYLKDNRATETHLLHPHFGELVMDLTYKKVYLTSVMNLSRTPVWEKQRILRPNRARAIADEKVSKQSFHMPGVLTMFQDIHSEQTGIIDGQHRAAALIILAQEGHWDPYARNVMVDVFPTTSEKEVMSLFTEINLGEPVRLIDMPTHDPVSSKMKVIIDEVVDQLTREYPAMFGGPRCRSPNLNPDKFRDDLFVSQFMSRHNLRTAKQLYRAVKKVNSALHRQKEEAWADMIGKVAKINLDDDNEASAMSNNEMQLPKGFFSAHKKARKNKFYLGLTSKWMGA